MTLGYGADAHPLSRTDEMYLAVQRNGEGAWITRTVGGTEQELTPRQPSEHETRRERIDPMLTASGWQVVALPDATRQGFAGHLAVEEYPTENGPADYALFSDGGLIGIVEAKSPSVGPQEVLRQAERYARGVGNTPWDFDGFHVRCICSSDGAPVLIEANLNRTEGGDYESAERLVRCLRVMGTGWTNGLSE